MSKPDAKFWDARARKYAASKIGDVDGYERTIAAVRARLKPSDAVYEFGCGTGTTALKLASAAARYVASDISPEMIAIAREKAQAEGAGNVVFEVGEAGAGQADASFDAVCGFNILHLIDGREAVLKSVHRLLKPGGLFISKTPCLKEMNFMLPLLVPVMQAFGQAPYVGAFNAATLEREIEAAGFEIIERARHGSKPKQEPRIYLVARKR
jgi:ubiquinone/menaquinone biosynthesis C-methylase UbiE